MNYKRNQRNYIYNLHGCLKDMDEETGLYYYGMRYYTAWLCRFINVDPLQFKYPYYTPFQYAGNMPITYIDLDGLEPTDPGTYNGKGKIATEKKDGVDVENTENQRWTWNNGVWNKVDFNITADELNSIFENGNKDALTELEIQINLNGSTYGINSKESVAHFLSQAGHEVGWFKNGLCVTENLNYSVDGLVSIFGGYFYKGKAIKNKKNADDYGRKKGQSAKQEDIANIVYANRMGNGDSNSGDGYKYRGRGIFQLTGKSLYSAFNSYINSSTLNYLDNPDLITSNNEISIKSAMWYFKTKVVDKVDIENTTVEEVTRRVNGGSNGLEDRRKIYNKAIEKIK